MDPNHDSRGGLEDEPFTYRASDDGKVFISWRGQQVTILRRRQASTLLTRLQGLDGQGQQLAMARITGNFKRGNEHSK